MEFLAPDFFFQRPVFLASFLKHPFQHKIYIYIWLEKKIKKAVEYVYKWVGLPSRGKGVPPRSNIFFQCTKIDSRWWFQTFFIFTPIWGRIRI